MTNHWKQWPWLITYNNDYDEHMTNSEYIPAYIVLYMSYKV